MNKRKKTMSSELGLTETVGELAPVVLKPNKKKKKKTAKKSKSKIFKSKGTSREEIGDHEIQKEQDNAPDSIEEKKPNTLSWEEPPTGDSNGILPSSVDIPTTNQEEAPQAEKAGPTGDGSDNEEENDDEKEKEATEHPNEEEGESTEYCGATIKEMSKVDEEATTNTHEETIDQEKMECLHSGQHGPLFSPVDESTQTVDNSSDKGDKQQDGNALTEAPSQPEHHAEGSDPR